MTFSVQSEEVEEDRQSGGQETFKGHESPGLGPPSSLWPGTNERLENRGVSLPPREHTREAKTPRGTRGTVTVSLNTSRDETHPAACTAAAAGDT